MDFPNSEYFCIFCDDTFTELPPVRRHYQRHLNYYPLMCCHCGCGATDMENLVNHHKEEHKDIGKAKFKKREQPLIETWINGFLYAQSTIVRSFGPREPCLVCEKLFKNIDLVEAKQRRSTVNRKIDHLHRHLCYFPFECVLCKRDGKEFRVAYFESKAHTHIKFKHAEIDETEDRWQIFQKTIAIPILDNLISDYFSRHGISMDVERRPCKKARDTLSPPVINSDIIPSLSSISSLHTNRLNGDGLNLSSNLCDNRLVKRNRLMAIVKQRHDALQAENQEHQQQQNFMGLQSNGDNDYKRFERQQHHLHQQQLIERRQNGDNSLVIHVAPSHAEYIESGINPVRRHQQDYFCLFCPERFESKLDAFPHYGEHLSYRPIVCLFCEERFCDVESFTEHQKADHNDTGDLFYEIREDEHLEKWVDDFLDYQSSSSCQQSILNCSCSTCCPVCDRLKRKINDNSERRPYQHCSVHDDLVFSDHIHYHLKYLAYECSFCKNNGQSVRFPNLEKLAATHVRTHYFIRDASVYQLSRAFPKTLAIVQLERLIAESVQKRRFKEKSWQSNRLDQLKIERLKMQGVNHPHGSTNSQGMSVVGASKSLRLIPVNNGIDNPSQHHQSQLLQRHHELQLQQQLQLQQRLQRRDEINRAKLMNNNNNTVLSRLSTNSNSYKANSMHVRIEGGRVVNLPTQQQQAPVVAPPPRQVAVSSQQHRNLVMARNEVQHLPKRDNNSKIIAVKCLNCHKQFANHNEFREHHNREHRGKTVRLYSQHEPLIASNS